MLVLPYISESKAHDSQPLQPLVRSPAGFNFASKRTGFIYYAIFGDRNNYRRP